MERINLFDGDSCIGSIYFIDNNRVTIDLDEIDGVFEVEDTSFVEITSLENYIQNDLGPIELDLSKDNDTYKLEISGYVLKVVDTDNNVIYERGCDDGCIENEEEF